MNQSEFRIFYRATYRPLWSYLYRMVRQADLCNDLTQESYFRFLKSDRAKADTGAAKSYLFTIATNLVRDHWRSGKVHGEWVEDSANDDIDTSADDLPLQLDLAVAMERLSLMHRSLLWLCYVEGYSHAEAAAIVGVESHSVKVLLSRARKKLAVICQEIGIGRERE